MIVQQHLAPTPLQPIKYMLVMSLAQTLHTNQMKRENIAHTRNYFLCEIDEAQNSRLSNRKIYCAVNFFMDMAQYNTCYNLI